MTQPRRYLTAAQVAKRLDVHPETVRAWVRTGKLKVVKLPSGVMRFRPEDIDAIETVQPTADAATEAGVA
jgi:excisionase family DNA binding protein